MQLIFMLLIGLFIFIFLLGIRVVRPTHRGLVERMGKYKGFANPGFHWITPFIDHIYFVNITEQMVDAQQQEIITNDNLNAMVDAQIYFKVQDTEKDVKASEYNVNNYKVQIVALARTTLRNVIGTMTLKDANSERNKINGQLFDTLKIETINWGINVVRTELKEIQPPQDVQDTMNKVVKALNEKTAAIDFATAAETKADGDRRAAIKIAEGQKQATILEAEGRAKAIELEYTASNKYFIENAQRLKQLEVTQASLENNTKVIVPSDTELVNVIGDLGGVLPIKKK